MCGPAACSSFGSDDSAFDEGAVLFHQRLAVPVAPDPTKRIEYGVTALIDKFPPVPVGEDGTATWQWTSESYPADAVSLRSISSDNFVIVDTTGEPRVIGETDFTSGPATLHPKAIYIIEGQLFQVEKLDFEGCKAFVREIDCDYYTDAITYSRVTILDTFEDVGSHSHGEVHVVSRVVGFKKIKFYTNENVGSGELDLPEQQMHTTAYWITVPPDVMDGLPYAPDDRRDGVVGLAFAMRQIAQLLLMCDRHDIGIAIDTAEPAEPRRVPRHHDLDRIGGGVGQPRALEGGASDIRARSDDAERFAVHGGPRGPEDDRFLLGELQRVDEVQAPLAAGPDQPLPDLLGHRLPVGGRDRGLVFDLLAKGAPGHDTHRLADVTARALLSELPVNLLAGHRPREDRGEESEGDD